MSETGPETHPLIEGQVLTHEDSYAFLTKGFWLTFVTNMDPSIPGCNSVFIESESGDHVEISVVDGTIFAKIHKLAAQ